MFIPQYLLVVATSSKVDRATRQHNTYLRRWCRWESPWFWWGERTEGQVERAGGSRGVAPPSPEFLLQFFSSVSVSRSDIVMEIDFGRLTIHPLILINRFLQSFYGFRKPFEGAMKLWICCVHCSWAHNFQGIIRFRHLGWQEYCRRFCFVVGRFVTSHFSIAAYKNNLYRSHRLWKH